jgi:putative membrane protein insertion efficiency factor
MIGRFVILIVRLYQITVSPLLGNCCRFYPSCSAYCIEADRDHGCVRGIWLTLKRLSKCHPFHPGGVDFVPEAGKPVCVLKHE